MLLPAYETTTESFGSWDWVNTEATREKPMAVTWELDNALPGDLFAAFAAAVA